MELQAPKQTQSQGCLCGLPLIMLLVRCFLSLQVTQPLPRTGTRPSSSQSKQTPGKLPAPPWLSSICVLLPSNMVSGALGFPVSGSPGLTLPLLSAFSILLWVFSFHVGQKQQRWCTFTLAGPALLVWPWTHWILDLYRILGLYTRLWHFVPPCPGPGRTLTLLSNLPGT